MATVVSSIGENPRDTSSAEQEEEMGVESPHMIRCRLWFYFSVSMGVVLLAYIDLTSNLGDFDPNIWISRPFFIALMFFLSLSVLTGLVFTAILFTALFIKQTDKVLFLDLEKTSGPTSELVAICACILVVVCYLISLPITHNNIEALFGGFAFNANLFYGSWIAFLTIVSLLYQFLKEYHDIDIISRLKSGGPRCIHWLFLLSTCIIVISSSSVLFAQSRCRSDDPVMPVITAYQPDITIELYCRRTKIGIGLGTSVAFVSIMILCELLYVEDYEKEVLLQSEMLFSVASSVALCWGTLVITGKRGSAATVGNLFYSIWLSFVISCTIVCSCLADLEERTFKKKMTQRINSRATNT